MEAYSETTIRFATREDTGAIMEFIGREWKDGHILGSDRSFFDYEHASGDAVNFVIAVKDETVVATLGYIPSSFGPLPDINTVIWKVAKRAGNAMLGIELLEFLRKSQRFRTVMSVGINEKTIGIYKFLGCYTDQLRQFVRFNDALNERRIAVAENPAPVPVADDAAGYSLSELREVTEFPFERFSDRIPFKDRNYYIKRFFEHPVYTYRTWRIDGPDGPACLFTGRVQEYNGATALRIVDVTGDERALGKIPAALGRLIREEGVEYADFFGFGFDEAAWHDAGFIPVDPASEALIVPNYFSPFVQKNVVIHFFADTESVSRLRVCKADGDQDRPS